MDIQVGDVITYKYINDGGKEKNIISKVMEDRNIKNRKTKIWSNRRKQRTINRRRKRVFKTVY